VHLLHRATLLTDPERQELRVTHGKAGLSCQLSQEIWDNCATVVRLEIEDNLGSRAR
jgi:hypothetical protein